MRNWENININNYTKSEKAYEDYLAIEKEIGDMNVLNPKTEIYRDIANRLYERVVILQMKEEG